MSDCLPCSSEPPECNCGEGFSCSITVRSCTQCPTTVCVPSDKPSNGGAIAGGVVGALAGVGLVAFLVYWFMFRKRRIANFWPFSKENTAYEDEPMSAMSFGRDQRTMSFLSEGAMREKQSNPRCVGLHLSLGDNLQGGDLKFALDHLHTPDSSTIDLSGLDVDTPQTPPNALLKPAEGLQLLDSPFVLPSPVEAKRSLVIKPRTTSRLPHHNTFVEKATDAKFGNDLNAVEAPTEDLTSPAVAIVDPQKLSGHFTTPSFDKKFYQESPACHSAALEKDLPSLPHNTMPKSASQRESLYDKYLSVVDWGYLNSSVNLDRSPTISYSGTDVTKIIPISNTQEPQTTESDAGLERESVLVPAPPRSSIRGRPRSSTEAGAHLLVTWEPPVTSHSATFPTAASENCSTSPAVGTVNTSNWASPVVQDEPQDEPRQELEKQVVSDESQHHNTSTEPFTSLSWYTADRPSISATVLELRPVSIDETPGSMAVHEENTNSGNLSFSSPFVGDSSLSTDSLEPGISSAPVGSLDGLLSDEWKDTGLCERPRENEAGSIFPSDNLEDDWSRPLSHFASARRQSRKRSSHRHPRGNELPRISVPGFGRVPVHLAPPLPKNPKKDALSST